MTPEERIRVRVDALDAAVRTAPFVGEDRTADEQERADAVLLDRALVFERWLLEPVAETLPAGLRYLPMPGGNPPFPRMR